jgi:phenylalanyl-tRNA synthetase beta chain
MRVPLSWLRDYVDLDLAPAELAEQLTVRGMEVSSIELTGGGWTDIVVGRLLEVERHPNADTLWLTRVDVGGGEPLEIVCGAQNIAPGQLVPVALVGSVLPGDRRIERTRIRGEVSNGMLCSPVELGLGRDADGILILGTADEHKLGTPLEQIVGETVLDVDVKPNRGDALSMVGLAREVGGDAHGFRFVQLPFNLAMPEALVAENHTHEGARVSLLEAAKALGVTVVASASIKQGEVARGLPGRIREPLGSLSTDAQTAIQFTRSTPGVTTALVGMSRRAHVEENLQLARVPVASTGDYSRLFTGDE